MKITYSNLRKTFAHGGKFTGIINDVRCTGAISFQNDRVYFCTNDERLDGCRTDQKFGFKYSWVLDTGVKEITKVNFKYTEKKPEYIHGYEYVISKGVLKIDCGAVKVKVSDIKDWLKGNKNKVILDILKQRGIENPTYLKRNLKLLFKLK